MEKRALERRIGERREVEGVEVGWLYGVPDAGPDGTVEVVSCVGDLIEVSATGAAVVAPHTPHVWVGCVVGMEFRGCKSTVTIRRIDRIFHEREFRTYGVEFTAPNSELARGVSDAFLARYSHLPRWRDPRYQAFVPPGEAL